MTDPVDPFSLEGRYRLLRQATEAANSHLELSGVLEALAGVLRPVVPLDGIAVVTCEGDDMVRPHAVHVEGLARRSGETVTEVLSRALDRPVEELGFSPEPGIPMAGTGTEYVGRTRRALVRQDLSAVRGFTEDDRMLTLGISSYVMVPLFVHDRFLGSITYARLTHRPFAAQEIELVEELSPSVATAVANSLAYGEIRRLKNLLHEENAVLREELDERGMFEEIVGGSLALRRVLEQVDKVGPTDATVLITGETGTGKELVARAIHRRSSRAGRAMIRVNCAALPESLIASELFGHEKGAFTGALQRRIGRFELAAGGSIFLDEVGDLPAEIQVALLRVLQEREFERVGGTRTLRTDARVIAATNRDLAAAVAEGRFRSDLFYRLHVFPIEVPPLRERRDDIPILVEYFAARHGARVRRRFRGIDPATMRRLVDYGWPGNVRELENVIERAVILCEGDRLTVDERLLARAGLGDPGTVRRPSARSSVPEAPAARAWAGSRGYLGPAPAADGEAPGVTEGPGELLGLREHEKRVIELALAESHGRVSGPLGAARKLGLAPSTLESKIRRHRIDKYRFHSR